MDEELLRKTGFSHLDPGQFCSEEIFLRGGGNAVLWVDSVSGHGILDPAHWVQLDYYEEDYRSQSSAKSDGAKLSSLEHLSIFKNLNKKQFRQIEKFLKKKANVLEIGCSFGGVLRQIAEFGVAACHAVEPNEEDACFVKNLISDVKLFSGLFDDAELAMEFYDLIVSFEVLEHVFSPRDFIEKTFRLLKPGGAVNFEVPNHRAALLRCYQNSEYNRFYYHKAHIHYFTSESLTQLFKLCGFEGETVSFSMYPFFNHVHWHLNRGPQASFEKALTTPHPAPAISEVGQAINDFYDRVESEYEGLMNRLGVSDCLVYQGRKK